MTHHDHHAQQHHGQQHHGQRRKPLHKHWLTWVVVGLMLAAMLMYVMSDDESLQPGQATPGPAMPEAAP